MGLLGMQFHVFSNECKMLFFLVCSSLFLVQSTLVLDEMLTVKLGSRPRLGMNF